MKKLARLLWSTVKLTALFYFLLLVVYELAVKR